MNQNLFPTISIHDMDALALDQFKKMDYYAIEAYGLPIELMMENAGLNLAILISSLISKKSIILIGIGNGNNGGGGLVAARRLRAWGYAVHVDLPVSIVKDLPKLQLDRAIKFGVNTDQIANPDIWVDAYLGFSQHLPLSAKYAKRIEEANACDCSRLSLDLPTGFLEETTHPYFKADHVLSLAALKKPLINLPKDTRLYLADLGIPEEVYQKFGLHFPPFDRGSILRMING
jgi:NAD(P)H-hydrate epimerase